MVSTCRVLICITGYARQLNMLIPLFHSLCWDAYVRIACFFTKSFDFYYGEEKRFYHELKKSLNYLIFKMWINRYFWWDGGSLGLLLKSELINGRKLIASPPILRSQRFMEVMKKGNFDFLDDANVIFSAFDSSDKMHYDYMKSEIPPPLFSKTVQDVSKEYKKHLTFVYAAHSGMLHEPVSV